MTTTRQLLVKLKEPEYQWLLQYATEQGMTIEGVVRMAIRAHNMLELTPGAVDAVAALRPRMPLLMTELS